MMTEVNRLLSIKEVSDYTGLAVGTIYNMVSQKRIPHVKLGRLTKFKPGEIERWVKDHSVKVRWPLAA